jgi:hypothetical protein
MAVNKAKRSIHLAQPQRRRLNPQPATQQMPQMPLMPVKSAIYRALADLTTGFDKVIHDFGTLKQSHFFRTGTLSALHGQLCVIRAQAIREFLSVMNEREAANAGYFERLRREREGTPPEPAPAG